MFGSCSSLQSAPTILRRAAVLSGTPFATIPRMPIEQIVQQLRAERDRLDAAIKALTGVGAANPERPSGGHKKTMSAAARKRISIAQKARWAKRTSKRPIGYGGSQTHYVSSSP